MTVPTLHEERALVAAGFHLIAGVDEVGRGAWAGPVAVCAVILPLQRDDLPDVLSCVRDSKQLSPLERVRLAPLIREVATAFAIGRAEAEEIDSRGIAPATRLAMIRALNSLFPPPDCLLLDAFPLPESSLPQRTIVHGDALCLSISAASVVAKVVRDQWMVDLDVAYPGYGFAQNKGYGTAAHRDALKRLGPTPLHRMTWAPMRTLTHGTGTTALSD